MGESAGAPLDAISGAIEDAVYSEGFIVTDSHHSPPAIYRMLGDGLTAISWWAERAVK